MSIDTACILFAWIQRAICTGRESVAGESARHTKVASTEWKRERAKVFHLSVERRLLKLRAALETKRNEYKRSVSIGWKSVLFSLLPTYCSLSKSETRQLEQYFCSSPFACACFFLSFFLCHRLVSLVGPLTGYTWPAVTLSPVHLSLVVPVALCVCIHTSN